MTNETDIRKALVAATKDFLTVIETIVTDKETFTDLPTIPEGDIGWENRTFDPIGKDPWASFFYVPNIPQGRTVGQGGIDELNGFIQIDFNVAPDSGESVLMEWEEKARIYFHPGRAFTYGGHSVLVTACGMSQGRTVENYYRKSVTVNFRSDLKRHKIG